MLDRHCQGLALLIYQIIGRRQRHSEPLLNFIIVHESLNMLVPIDSQIIIFYAPLLLSATEYKSQILKIIVIGVRFIHHNP